MPQAIIPALITAAVSGTGMGLQASGALTPDQPKTTATATNPLNNPNAIQQEQQAFRANAGNAAEAGQGFLSTPSESALIASLAGSPGDISLAQSTIFGTPQSQPSVFGSGTPGLASAVG